jgi:hypothetical protein
LLAAWDREASTKSEVERRVRIGEYDREQILLKRCLSYLGQVLSKLSLDQSIDAHSSVNRFTLVSGNYGNRSMRTSFAGGNGKAAWNSFTTSALACGEYLVGFRGAGTAI